MQISYFYHTLYQTGRVVILILLMPLMVLVLAVVLQQK